MNVDCCRATEEETVAFVYLVGDPGLEADQIGLGGGQERRTPARTAIDSEQLPTGDDQLDMGPRHRGRGIDTDQLDMAVSGAVEASIVGIRSTAEHDGVGETVLSSVGQLDACKGRLIDGDRALAEVDRGAALAAPCGFGWVRVLVLAEAGAHHRSRRVCCGGRVVQVTRKCCFDIEIAGAGAGAGVWLRSGRLVGVAGECWWTGGPCAWKLVADFGRGIWPNRSARRWPGATVGGHARSDFVELK